MPDAPAIGRRGAERPIVLAVDIGTSSVRAALHDRGGRTIEGTAVQIAYAWDVTAAGAVRLPAERLLDLVWQALGRVHQAAGPLVSDVVAGGISCFFHSIVGLDADARPVTPVLSWADSTSADEAAGLRARIDAAASHARTGTPIHASYWPARILHLRREQPRATRWAGFPDLLLASLTGQLVMSRSMASGTGLLDRALGTWSAALTEAIEIDTRELPGLVADDEPLAPGGTGVQRVPAGFERLSWFAAWGDGGCGNVGLTGAGRGQAALMVGTSGALRIILDDPVPNVPEGLFGYRFGSGSLVGGQLSEGGGLLAWVARLLGRSPRSLERAAATMAADGHGLTVLPYTFGERGLGYHDDARGALMGMTARTDATAIYRAMLESIALGFAAVDEQLQAVVGHPPAIVAAGGALRHSPTLAGILADALGREIGLATDLEASRRGAALLTLRGAGLIADLDDVPGPRVQTIASDPDRAARYVAARARSDVAYDRILGGRPTSDAARPPPAASETTADAAIEPHRMAGKEVSGRT